MSAIDTFRVKYPRPTKLSDPYHDFSDEGAQRLLDIPDDQLDGVHYRLLFGPYLPAGTYEEIAYYLPQGFKYLRANPRNDIGEFIHSIGGFIAKNKARLQQDGMFVTVRGCVRECLAYWTEQLDAEKTSSDDAYYLRAMIDEVMQSEWYTDLQSG